MNYAHHSECMIPLIVIVQQTAPGVFIVPLDSITLYSLCIPFYTCRKIHLNRPSAIFYVFNRPY